MHLVAAACLDDSQHQRKFIVFTFLKSLRTRAHETCFQDPLVSPYVKRVLTGVLQTLNTTKQRLSLLPGGPQLVDSTRVISDIQEALSRKPQM